MVNAFVVTAGVGSARHSVWLLWRVVRWCGAARGLHSNACFGSKRMHCAQALLSCWLLRSVCQHEGRITPQGHAGARTTYSTRVAFCHTAARDTTRATEEMRRFCKRSSDWLLQWIRRLGRCWRPLSSELCGSTRGGCGTRPAFRADAQQPLHSCRTVERVPPCAGRVCLRHRELHSRNAALDALFLPHNGSHVVCALVLPSTLSHTSRANFPCLPPPPPPPLPSRPRLLRAVSLSAPPSSSRASHQVTVAE